MKKKGLKKRLKSLEERLWGLEMKVCFLLNPPENTVESIAEVMGANSLEELQDCTSLQYDPRVTNIA